MKSSNNPYLTSAEYWEECYPETDIDLPVDNDIRKWLESNLSFNEFNECFEIGCFPGRYLTIFAKNGIQVNGLDIHKYTISLKEIFINKGYKTGDFIRADFLKYKPVRRFKCVYSFGFIEHFQNWEEVLQKHIDLTDKDGIIIIEVPNFRGIFQRIPRFLFDKENFFKHNLNSMVLKKWLSICRRNNIEIIYNGYFGGFNLWYEKQYKSRIINYLKYYTYKFLYHLLRILFKSKDSRHFSSYIGLIGVRR
jgi:L-malate glycosyltransferase